MKTGGRGFLHPLLFAAVIAAACALPAAAGSTAAQVAFTEGVIAFDRGDPEMAEVLFAEAVQNDPDQGTFLHWLGLANLRRGRVVEAVAHFKESLKARCAPAAGRARVKADLRRAREALAGAQVTVTAPEYRSEALCLEELPLWEGRIGLESGWDSNPELVTEERPFVLPGETIPRDVPSDSATYLNVAAGFHPVSGFRGWDLGLALSGHQSKYREEDALDLTFVDGAVSLGWGADPRGALEGPLGVQPVPVGPGRVALLLQGGGSRAWLSGDPYRTTVDLAASLFVHETSVATARIGVGWSDRDFPGDGFPLLRPSGEELLGSVDQWFFFGRPDRSLRLGAAAGRYESDRFFDRELREASAEAMLPLASRWTLGLAGEIREDDYTHRESGLLETNPPRQDTTWRTSATVLWRSTDRLVWNFRASHARRDSNIEVPFFDVPLLDYDRTLVSLGVQWYF
ncbi:MAG TPA: tetratricopeptide repeat protein [Thermoanaerobaculia bacterium]|nr:tetratricopeptide repeat protein [Thermoanaerobaculia bacterium]